MMNCDFSGGTLSLCPHITIINMTRHCRVNGIWEKCVFKFYIDHVWFITVPANSLAINRRSKIVFFQVPWDSSDSVSHKWTKVRFLSLARSKFILCSANHRPCYLSNLPCDRQSTALAYSEQETDDVIQNGRHDTMEYRGTWNARNGNLINNIDNQYTLGFKYNLFII